MTSKSSDTQLTKQLEDRLLSAPGGGPARRSDYDLNPNFPDRPTSLRDAAVLVPIVRREPWTVLFTRRADELSSHAGQVSFPGGRVDQDDRDLVHTALRETEEEIGVSAHQVDVAGFLETYETRTGFLITPVVGLVHPDFELQINAQEVAEVFEVPLDYLLEPGNYETRSLEWQGAMRFFYAVSYQNHYIWGATAGMLKALHDRVSET